jgi:hypothetical protein
MVKKKFIGHTPKDGKSYSPADIADFLNKFQLHETLRIIGVTSHDWFLTKEQTDVLVRGVPISEGV